jgi:hypothetical protein
MSEYQGGVEPVLALPGRGASPESRVETKKKRSELLFAIGNASSIQQSLVSRKVGESAACQRCPSRNPVEIPSPGGILPFLREALLYYRSSQYRTQFLRRSLSGW